MFAVARRTGSHHAGQIGHRNNRVAEVVVRPVRGRSRRAAPQRSGDGGHGGRGAEEPVTMEQRSLGRLRCSWPASKDRLCFAGRHLVLATALNLVWEIAQLPLLHNLGRGTSGPKFSCRGPLHPGRSHHRGDGSCRLGSPRWTRLAEQQLREDGHLCDSALCRLYDLQRMAECLEVRETWTYNSMMPRLPWIGTGLAPLFQWLIVPTTSFLILRRFVPERINGQFTVTKIQKAR